MLTMSECTRKNTCYDCDNEACWHHGKKEADCPKYGCDNDKPYDCEHCSFIDKWIEEERKRYSHETDKT